MFPLLLLFPPLLVFPLLLLFPPLLMFPLLLLFPPLLVFPLLLLFPPLLVFPLLLLFPPLLVFPLSVFVSLYTTANTENLSELNVIVPVALSNSHGINSALPSCILTILYSLLTLVSVLISSLSSFILNVIDLFVVVTLVSEPSIFLTILISNALPRT